MKRQCKAKSTTTGRRCRKAPIKGGTVCRNHGGSAPQVKRKAKERLLIADTIKAIGLKAGQDPDLVVSAIAAIAFGDPGDLFDERGKLKPMKQLPSHVRSMIKSQEVVRGNVDQGDGKFDEVVKVQLWDKSKMLELLAKHHGLLEERTHVDQKVVYTWEEPE